MAVLKINCDRATDENYCIVLNYFSDCSLGMSAAQLMRSNQLSSLLNIFRQKFLGDYLEFSNGVLIVDTANVNSDSNKDKFLCSLLQ